MNNRYIPIPKWNEYHPEYPSQSAWRHLIFHAETNGLNKAIRRVGRRILISEKDFFEWIESNGSPDQSKQATV